VPQTITELTHRSQELKAQGRVKEALALLREATQIAPDNLATLHNYAAGLGDVGRNVEAVDVLKKAFAMGLNASQSWLVYARALSGMQAFDEAQDAFLRLLNGNPSDVDAHRDLSQLIWMLSGDRDQALQYINRAIEQNPSNWGLHVERAKIYGQTGDPEMAFAVLSELAARSNGAPILEVAACNAALGAEKFEAAVKHGARACAQAPDDVAAGTAYASALLSVGDTGDALIIIDRLRKRQPLNQLFIALQATAWRLLGDDRYETLMDYDALVYALPLDKPTGWRNLDHYLDDLVEALDRMHAFRTHPFSQSVRHGSQISSINHVNNAALQAFEEAVRKPMMRYLDQLGGGNDPIRQRNFGTFQLFSAWSILLPARGYHVNHVHPEGWISSACHLRPPVDEPDKSPCRVVKIWSARH